MASNNCKVQITNQCGPLPHSRPNICNNVRLKTTTTKHFDFLVSLGKLMGAGHQCININISVKSNTIHKPKQGKNESKFPEERLRRRWKGQFLACSLRLYSVCIRKMPGRLNFSQGDTALSLRHWEKTAPYLKLFQCRVHHTNFPHPRPSCVLPTILIRLSYQFHILLRPRPPPDLSRPPLKRLAAAILHNTIARYT